jgi:hypothetical protein
MWVGVNWLPRAVLIPRRFSAWAISANLVIGATSVEFSTGDLRELESVASKITVKGARYPEHLQKLVGR